MKHRAFLTLRFGAIVTVVVGAGLLIWPDLLSPERRIEDLPGVRGTVRLSQFGHGASDAPLEHTTVYVNNHLYAGMEDNDIRGFVDGRYKNAWNQPGQVHLRIGRREKWPAYGEHEILRTLFRWDGIHLPPGSRLKSGRLELMVEAGPDLDLHVYLYAVNKDWNPGHGGTNRDSSSPPVAGEVWWNDVAHGSRPWGLPGAGFAHDSHPEADTPVSPLAVARYSPGMSSLQFESEGLTLYAGERLERREPLLFLLKLSDALEDTPKTRLYLYSGNHGDDHATDRRPHLSLTWSNARESRGSTTRVFLEHGRSRTYPRVECEGATQFAATFEPHGDSELPTLEIRGGDESTTSDWIRADHPVDRTGWRWMQLRVRALTEPVDLGREFEATLGDTWVISGPPHEQAVEWTFVSPDGTSHRTNAEYQGEYRWRVRFRPTELGRWTYSWTSRFDGPTYKSIHGRFDVIAGSTAAVIAALDSLGNRIQAADIDSRDERIEEFGWSFVRLERAGLRLQTPESFRSSGSGLRTKLDEIRSLLCGKKIEGKQPLGHWKRRWWSKVSPDEALRPVPHVAR